MTGTRTCTLAFVGLSALGAAAPAPTWTFDDSPAASPPQGFVLASLLQPSAGVWTVQHEGANGFLAHAADAMSAGYSVAVAPAEPLRDVLVATRLRLTGGARAGGVVWRYEDADNFYMAVLDLNRRQLALFRIFNGNRIVLEREGDLELDTNAWHALKIVHDGSQVSVMLGGIRVFDERDRRGGDGGSAGVVSTGDSEVWFDDLRIEPGGRR